MVPRPAGYLLIFCTAAARNGLEYLDLFAATGVLDKVPDKYEPLFAGAGTLQASVVRLYGVVVILGRWVRVGCARLRGVHEAPPRGPGSGVLVAPPGPFLYPTSQLYTIRISYTSYLRGFLLSFK